jgi:hypothetical protein
VLLSDILKKSTKNASKIRNLFAKPEKCSILCMERSKRQFYGELVMGRRTIWDVIGLEKEVFIIGLLAYISLL